MVWKIAVAIPQINIITIHSNLQGQFNKGCLIPELRVLSIITV